MYHFKKNQAVENFAGRILNPKLLSCLISKTPCGKSFRKLSNAINVHCFKITKILLKFIPSLMSKFFKNDHPPAPTNWQKNRPIAVKKKWSREAEFRKSGQCCCRSIYMSQITKYALWQFQFFKYISIFLNWYGLSSSLKGTGLSFQEEKSKHCYRKNFEEDEGR